MLLPTFTSICDRCYSHIGLLLLTNNNTYRWPDVKPLCFGLDVIDHVLWIRVGHLADVKAMFDGRI